MKFFVIFFIFISYFISNDSLGLGKKNFFSTKYNEVNIRNGPGKKYFIIATLYQKGIPLKRLSFFDAWVQIEDISGLKGWISKSQLSDRRHAYITAESTYIYRYPNSKSKKVARLYKDVIIKVKKCKKDWCKIRIKGFDGWILKNYMWGIESNEIF